MQIDCEKCGKGFMARMAPCPEGRQGCLVAHYDKESWLCTHCGHDNGPAITEAFQKGPWHQEVGLGVVNTAAIQKLEFTKEEKQMEEKEFAVLGLVGPAGSGKDLVADWFTQRQFFVKVAFADPMKRFVMKTFPGINEKHLWGPSEERNREFDVGPLFWFEAIGHFGDGAKEIVNEVLDPGIRIDAYLKLHDWFTWLHKTYPNKISARVILQTMGTEWGRAVDPLLWAKYAHKVAAKIKEGFIYDQIEGLYTASELRNFATRGVIIPDHRFKNEIATTQELGGYVIRLHRVSQEKEVGNVGIQGHQSEVELRSIPADAFDFVLELQEGIDKVHWALENITKERSWEIKRRANNPS